MWLTHLFDSDSKRFSAALIVLFDVAANTQTIFQRQ
jgi:hypothetical protein